MDIQGGKPEVVGVDTRYAGLLRIRVPLTPRANADWVTIFNRMPTGVNFTFDMHEPKASSALIEGLTPDDKLETYVGHIRERIAGANRDYNHNLAPKLRAQRDAADREKSEIEARLAEARRRAEQL